MSQPHSITPENLAFIEMLFLRLEETNSSNFKRWEEILEESRNSKQKCGERAEDLEYQAKFVNCAFNNHYFSVLEFIIYLYIAADAD